MRLAGGRVCVSFSAVPAVQRGHKRVVPSADANTCLPLTLTPLLHVRHKTRQSTQIRVARLWRDPKVKMGILAVVAVTLLLVCLILYFTIYRGPSKTEFDVRRREERRRRKERRRDEETKRRRDKETKRGEAKRDEETCIILPYIVYVSM